MALRVLLLCLRALWLAMMLGVGGHCDDGEPLCGAYAPGDIIIGILGSVHSTVNDLQSRIHPYTYTCKDFDLDPFVHSLAVIHTIETINDSGFLPGIRLGYQMCDPCAYATKALQCVEHMISINQSLPVLADYSNFTPTVKAFLGERYSELSIPVAKFLSLYMIPQISCTSSSPALSDKLRYVSFFRVIPSDIYQTQALAKFMKYFNWNWVGVVTLDDDYGKPALESFLLRSKEQGICVHFQKILPNYLDSTNITQLIKEVADKIRSSNATVVLLILRPELVQMLFEEMIRTNTSRIWIASDAWSTVRFLMKMKNINKVGEIFGFSFLSGNIPGFKDYLQNLTVHPGVKNDFIREYKQMRFNCSSGSEHKSPLACQVTDPQEANDDYLLQAVDLADSYGQRLAVYALAHAIKQLLQCNDTACPGDTDFTPWKLLEILRYVNFTLDNHEISFNEFGDSESVYDLVSWKRNGEERTLEVMGKFLINNEEIEIYQDKIPWSNDTQPSSRCSKPCPAGTQKNISPVFSCCYTCINCSEGYYSDRVDQSTCEPCPNGTWSRPGSSACQKRKIAFLEWSSAHSIVVMVGTALGALLLIFSLVVFILNKEDKHIQDIFIISCLMKFGLLVSFGNVIVFLGDPNIHLCRAQQLMYGLGYTLCISCILVKAFHTFLGVMSINPDKKRKLSKCDKPPFIIALCIVPQVLICTFWMIFDRVEIKETQSTTDLLTMNRLCTQGSMYGFGAMHVYIALIAVICFGLALKGKDEETEPVIFSMLIHLFAWFCFIPIFITQYESRPIVQLSAIMVFNYGVIFCHFTPKWVKVLSKKPKKPPQPPLCPEDQDDGDSGYNPTLSPSPTLIRSVSQGRFSFTESEPSNQDNNSLHMSEFRVSIRHRRITSIRRRSY